MSTYCKICSHSGKACNTCKRRMTAETRATAQEAEVKAEAEAKEAAAKAKAEAEAKEAAEVKAEAEAKEAAAKAKAEAEAKAEATAVVKAAEARAVAEVKAAAETEALAKVRASVVFKKCVTCSAFSYCINCTRCTRCTALPLEYIQGRSVYENGKYLGDCSRFEIKGVDVIREVSELWRDTCMNSTKKVLCKVFSPTCRSCNGSAQTVCDTSEMESYVKWMRAETCIIRERCLSKTAVFPSLAGAMQKVEFLLDEIAASEKLVFTNENNLKVHKALDTPEFTAVWQDVYGTFSSAAKAMEQVSSLDKLIDTAFQGLQAMEALNCFTPNAGAGGP